ncbi:dihydroorotate dehydrogenase electron transfer subunit [Olsenella sp. HMSC062G07]|uniref:dihydroorotate dehydrogenase electron transfer subunit n=1 Tax=Olsenella sp. HMSC062G07 TaxID=1739330 RepID=UPI000B0A29BB|nr:dihydroorotate dehydrogenase electron transfer subunit [Olsenella sp. HMSC062G07]
MPKPRPSLHEAEVVENAAVAAQTFRMVLRAPRLAEALAPGQFLSLRVPRDKSQLLRIPLSFSRADAATGTVELVYAVVGAGTEALADLRAGERVSAVGPGGVGWPLPDGGRTLLVAGGVGAPPIVAAAGLLAAHDLPFDAIVGARSKDRLWGERQLRDLGAHHTLVTTDDGSYGLGGLTTDAMAQCLAARPYDLVMACGPTRMMAGVASLAEKAHVRCLVSLEQLMACGFGACGCCNVPLRNGGYASCCMDGPVFDGSEVAW